MCPLAATHADRHGERHPEDHCDLEQTETAEDCEPSPDDDRKRQCHPERHRPPPEVQWLGDLGADREKAHDQPEVRRVEDVCPPEANQVLREQPDRSRAGEDPPAVEAPPVAVLGSVDPQNERNAVAGDERARRPHDHAVAEERDRELEQACGSDRDQNLRDREVEPERDLPENVQRDDDRGEVQPRIANRRQEHRVGGPADLKPRPIGPGQGGGTHHQRIVLGSLPRASRSPRRGSGSNRMSRIAFGRRLRRDVPARYELGRHAPSRRRSRGRCACGGSQRARPGTACSSWSGGRRAVATGGRAPPDTARSQRAAPTGSPAMATSAPTAVHPPACPPAVACVDPCDLGWDGGACRRDRGRDRAERAVRLRTGATGRTGGRGALCLSPAAGDRAPRRAQSRRRSATPRPRRHSPPRSR